MEKKEWLKSKEAKNILKKMSDHGLGLLLDKEEIGLILSQFPNCVFEGKAYRTRIVPLSKFTANSLGDWDFSYKNISWSKDDDMWDRFIDESIEMHGEDVFFDVWTSDVYGLDLTLFFQEMEKIGENSLYEFKKAYGHEAEVLVIDYSSPKRVFAADRSRNED